MEEIWKDIEGLEGYCQVSSYGRVRELDNGSWSLLDPELNGKYGSKPLVNLGRKKMIEYLVCREFICKDVRVSFTRSTIKDDGVKVYILMHKDGSYLNNHVDNLYWKCLGDSGSKEVGEYLWDETFEELRAIDDEISRNAALAEHFLDGSYINFDDVRIIYFVS